MRFVKSSCLLLASLTFLGTALAAPTSPIPDDARKSVDVADGFKFRREDQGVDVADGFKLRRGEEEVDIADGFKVRRDSEDVDIADGF